jgi:hypothetical protein
MLVQRQRASHWLHRPTCRVPRARRQHRLGPLSGASPAPLERTRRLCNTAPHRPCVQTLQTCAQLTLTCLCGSSLLTQRSAAAASWLSSTARACAQAGSGHSGHPVRHHSWLLSLDMSALIVAGAGQTHRACSLCLQALLPGWGAQHVTCVHCQRHSDGSLLR